MGQVEELTNQIMDLKFTSNSFQRQATKCDKRIKSDKLKLKKVIASGNMEAARIYAENFIRKRKEHIHYLRLSSRLDAVVVRFDTPVKKIMISKSTGNSHKMPETMDQFENMKVQAEFMKSSKLLSTLFNSMMQQTAVAKKMNNVKVEEGDLFRRFDKLKASC